jgi:phosphoglycolate phosphatase
MMNKIFFDFDGTLIDSTQRLFNLFQHLVPASGFSYDHYWKLKRQQQDHQSILKEHFSHSKDEIASFQKQWMELIEHEIWLAYDQPFAGVKELLEELHLQYNLFLVTSRQHNHTVWAQLENFGWSNLFTEVFITNQTKEKAEMIKSRLSTGEQDWFVGDTGIDVLQGKLLGTKTAAVLSGFRNEESLTKYNPDIIIESVLDLPLYLKK